MTKWITILLITGLILSPLANLAFGGPNFAFAQNDQTMKVPESSEELKEVGKKFLESIPKAIGGAWQEAVKIWRGMWGWFKNLWNSYIFPWFKSIWQKISNFFLTSVWERFKELIKQSYEYKKSPGRRFFSRIKK